MEDLKSFAFPNSGTNATRGGQSLHQDGMTKLEYFAAAALTGILAADPTIGEVTAATKAKKAAEQLLGILK